MENLRFTREQVKEILGQIAQQEGGMNELLRLSMEALMKAEREIHNQIHKDVSNGFRRRKSLGLHKQLVLDVPRSRFQAFYPVLLAVMNDREQEAREIAFRLYGAGLTTQQVGELFEELYGRHYSTSQVSRMFDMAREEVSRWLCRPLERYYPIIYIDASFISTRRAESVSKEAYYTILGVKADRSREVLGIVNFPTESAQGWMQVMNSLKERGLERIDLVVSDALAGIEEAVAAGFGPVAHQFCVVHLKRQILKEVKVKDRQQISDELKQVFAAWDASDSVAKGWSRWEAFLERWCKKYPRLGKMKTPRYRHYFTYLQYDYRIRSMLYTTNWIERLNRDYKRTTRMRGSLPNPQAAILLLGYVAMNRKAYLRKVPKLIYETKFDWEE